MSSVEAENNPENEENLQSEKEESGEEFDSDTSSSEGYDSSDLEFDDSEKDKEYACAVTDIEEQFNIIRQIYKSEKHYEIDTKLNQILEETSVEYLQPLEELKEIKNIRIQTAEVMKNYRTQNLKSFYDAERLATEQNFKNEKVLLREEIKKDIEDKIRKLNEDRYKADNDFLSEPSYNKRSRKYSSSYSDEFGEKRRKPVTISGPFIVHRLKDEEIMEDINFIKCCLRSHKNNYLFL